MWCVSMVGNEQTYFVSMVGNGQIQAHGKYIIYWQKFRTCN